MPRYVVLEHDHPERHWDFMLEAGAILRTWRLESPPAPGPSIPAHESFDHRVAYLDYEGPISGDRGTVVRWDWGCFEWNQKEADRLVVAVNGRCIAGIVVLARVQGQLWSLSLQSARSQE